MSLLVWETIYACKEPQLMRGGSRTASPPSASLELPSYAIKEAALSSSLGGNGAAEWGVGRSRSGWKGNISRSTNNSTLLFPQRETFISTSWNQQTKVGNAAKPDKPSYQFKNKKIYVCRRRRRIYKRCAWCGSSAYITHHE